MKQKKPDRFHFNDPDTLKDFLLAFYHQTGVLCKLTDELKDELERYSISTAAIWKQSKQSTT